MSDDPIPRPRAPARPRVRRRTKIVRWTPKREAAFLRGLAAWSNVQKACRLSGLSDSAVYRRRLADEGFRARWADALREGVAALELLLLERALHGVEKPVWHGGKQVGTMREYSDRLALALVAAHRAAGTAPPGGAGHLSDDEARAELARRLSEMNVRLGGDG